MPENFAFNTGHNHLFRRLDLDLHQPARRRRTCSWSRCSRRRCGALALPLAALVFAGLLFTISRSALTGLVAGLVVLALARREWWPLAVVVIVIGVGHRLRPRVHARRADDALPPGRAEGAGGERAAAPAARRPSSSTSTSRPGGATCPASATGSSTVVHHPQGYGLGNAGATAERFGVDAEGGRVELHGDRRRDRPRSGWLAFVAWNLALLAGLVRRAWSGAARRAARRRRRSRRRARRDPADRRADRRLRHPLARPTASGGSRGSLTAASFALDEQRQALKAADATVSPTSAPSSQRAFQISPPTPPCPYGLAALDDPRLVADERLGADLRPPALRPPDRPGRSARARRSPDSTIATTPQGEGSTKIASTIAEDEGHPVVGLVALMRYTYRTAWRRASSRSSRSRSASRATPATACS